MSGFDTNTILPEDELQAALAEIEKMSEEEAAAIPSLDDGREGQGGSNSRLSAPKPGSSTPDVAETPAPGEIAAVAPEAPEAESSAALEQPGTMVEDIDESAADSDKSEATAVLAETVSVPPEPGDAAAIAEAGATPVSGGPVAGEELSATPAEIATAPSESQAVPTPAGTALENGPAEYAEREPPTEPLTSEVADHGTPEEVAATAAAHLAKKKIRFTVGKQSAEQDVAEYRPPDERGDVEVTGSSARPTAPMVKRFYRAVDRVLDALNRPFGSLGERGRVLVGWVALTTLIVSILVAVLMPLILPHRDAVAFLQEKRARLDPPPAAPDEAGD